MAYCKQCGAYIPDGLSACLACGYDEAAEQNRNGAAASTQNEDFRRKYEEEHRKRQEENRRWAEEERQRREEERRRQEENRRWAEEERKRREEEQRKNWEQQQAAERERRSRTYAYRAASGAGTQGKNRILAALSYLSVLFVLPRFLCPEDEFARYHARQGLTLFVFSIICDAISAAVPIGWVLSLFRLYCIYKGMTNALNDRVEPLPYIGKFGEKD